MINKTVIKVIQSLYQEYAINYYNKWEPSPDIKDIIRKAAKINGLEVLINRNNTYFYKDGVYVGGLVRNRSSFVTSKTAEICRQKYNTLVILKENGIPVADGKVFDICRFEEALNWVKKHNRRVVVKPANYEGGKGVTVNVNEVSFPKAWEYCVVALKKKKDKKILVETYHPGVDIRLLVINKRVICATTRLPANVIGDGVNTIRYLIQRKNQQRLFNPYLREKLIVINDHVKALLKHQLLSLDSIPQKDRVVLLDEVTNVARSAEPVDVTDIISDQLKDLAIRAVQTIPGLDYAGVDVIATSFYSATNAIVNEINTYNDIRMHYYPVLGKPRDPANYLIKCFLKKHELFVNCSLQELNDSVYTAIKQQNTHEAIAALHHVLTRYSKPPLKLFIKLSRLYLEDNNLVMAEEMFKKAYVLCDEDKDTIDDIILIINAYKQVKVEELNKQLKHNKRELDKTIKAKLKYESKYKLRKKQNEELKNKIVSYSEEMKRLKIKYKRIKQSRIWRYSKPLRSILKLVRGHND